MLLGLAQWLQAHYPEQLGFLRVFQYLTFRAVLAAMTAMLIGLAFGPWVINRLAEMKIGQPIREYGVAAHIAKSGTPTMGGVLVLIGIGVSTLLWFDWSNRFVWIVMLVTFGFGAIGWVDDWRKVVHKNPEGMRSREKYFWQSLIGLVAAFYLCFAVSESSNLRVFQLFMRWVQSGFSTGLPPNADLLVPFFKTISYPLGVWGFIILTYLVIVGASNAVNLTDGLDGLAIMPEKFAFPAIVEHATDVLDRLQRIVLQYQIERLAVVDIDEERHLLWLAPGIEFGLFHAGKRIEIRLELRLIFLELGVFHLGRFPAIDQHDVFF